jgi:sulfur carrier protein ThiS
MTETNTTPAPGGVPTENGTTFSGNVRALPGKVDPEDLLAAYDEVDEATEEAPAAKPNAAPPKIQVEADTIGRPPKEAAPKQEEQPEVEQEAPKNVLKAKVGDQELDIPEEATITQEVNGKKVQFKVQEAVKALVNQESFNRAMDSRLSRLHAKETEHVKQVTSIQQRLQQIIKHAEEGDLFGLFQFTAGMANKDPVDFEQQMLEKFHQIHGRFEHLTPDQKLAYFAQRKANFLEKKFKEMEQKTQYEQSVSQLEQTVNSRCQQEGVDREIFDGLFHQIVTQFVGKQPFNQKQLNSPDDVTVDDVFIYKNKLDMVDKVERAVQAVAPDKANPEFVLKVLNVVGNDFDLTEADIKDLLQQGGISLQTPAQENLSSKAQLLEKKGFGAQSIKGQASSNTQKQTDDDELWNEFARRRR